MVAKLKLDSVSSRSHRPHSRRAKRLVASDRIVIQSGRGDHCAAELRNVSNFGCSVKSDAPWLRTGSFISITLAEDWTINAVLRWVRGDQAGAEFLRPIDEREVLAIAGNE